MNRCDPDLHTDAPTGNAPAPNVLLAFPIMSDMFSTGMMLGQRSIAQFACCDKHIAHALIHVKTAAESTGMRFAIVIRRED